MIDYKIGVTLVTYNRLEKLKKTIEAYNKLTYKPSFVIIYDNNSNDGTKEFLKSLDNNYYIVIYGNDNLGGSYGFNKAIEESLKYEYDYLWIADDDAYPDIESFKILNDYINKHADRYVICGSVIENNEINLFHRRYINESFLGVKEIPSKIEDYKKDSFEINLFSFVGTAIKKDVILDIGLPNKDFFIWYDDTEYSMRINKKYKIYCVTSIKINHDVSLDNNFISWKNYYNYRNQLFSYKYNLKKHTFNMFYLKNKLGIIKWKFKNNKIYLLKKEALKDFKNNKLGISNKYRPGVKI